MATISLLPGWGLGLAALQPLVEAVSAQHEVQLLPLPECTALQQALDELDAQIPAGNWLAGWSLGGMLATALASRRGADCPGLITLASNPCFVAREDWPHGMPPAVFKAFSRSASRDWATTRAGFVQLCLQGESASITESARPVLQSTAATQLAPGTQGTHAPDPAHNACGQTDTAPLTSLAWLEQLDNRAAIEHMGCKQLHLLAVADALVPASVAGPLARLNARASIRALPGSHAFVVTRPQVLADTLHGFIQPAMGATHDG